MPATVDCHACGETVDLAHLFPGQVLLCRKCGAQIKVPAYFTGSLPKPAPSPTTTRNLTPTPTQRPTPTAASNPVPAPPPKPRRSKSKKSDDVPAWAIVSGIVFSICLLAALARRHAGLVGCALIFPGIFFICGAFYDWNWFVNHHKARVFILLFGRGGARVCYGILGGMVIVLGLSMGLQFTPIKRTPRPRPQMRLTSAADMHMATISIEGLPAGFEQFVMKHLGVVNQTTNGSWNSRNGETTIHLTPIRDLQALTDSIDFGKVTEIDESGWRIVVRADPSKLPQSPPPWNPGTDG